MSGGANVIALVSIRVGVVSVDKNFNLDHKFKTIKDRAFIIRMIRPFRHMVPFDLGTLTFDLLLNNFNLGHNFQTRSDRAFILNMRIPCDKTFHMVP